MKTKLEKRMDENRKRNRELWKAMRIENTVKVYGFNAVKASLTAWLNYQRENAKLLKEKRELENKLKEIEKKL